MRQAIVTKYLGPTNSRGSRVKATADAGSVTLVWDDALNSEDNHLAAATALATKYGWLAVNANRWRLVGGGLPSRDGNCYVIVPAVPLERMYSRETPGGEICTVIPSTDGRSGVRIYEGSGRVTAEAFDALDPDPRG